MAHPPPKQGFDRQPVRLPLRGHKAIYEIQIATRPVKIIENLTLRSYEPFRNNHATAQK
jgi:hypothetical protein